MMAVGVLISKRKGLGFGWVLSGMLRGVIWVFMEEEIE